MKTKEEIKIEELEKELKKVERAIRVLPRRNIWKLKELSTKKYNIKTKLEFYKRMLKTNE